MKKALITGVTGQDGPIYPSWCCLRATRCSVSSVGCRPSTPSGSGPALRPVALMVDGDVPLLEGELAGG